MKLPWPAGLVGIVALIAIARPDAMWTLYDQTYPSDVAQRQALDACFIENGSFNRLDSAAREGCYQRKLVVAQATAFHGGPQSAVRYNFVDRWREAGQGGFEIRTYIAVAGATEGHTGELWFYAPIPIFAVGCTVAVMNLPHSSA